MGSQRSPRCVTSHDAKVIDEILGNGCTYSNRGTCVLHVACVVRVVLVYCVRAAYSEFDIYAWTLYHVLNGYICSLHLCVCCVCMCACVCVLLNVTSCLNMYL